MNPGEISIGIYQDFHKNIGWTAVINTYGGDGRFTSVYLDAYTKAECFRKLAAWLEEAK